LKNIIVLRPVLWGIAALSATEIYSRIVGWPELGPYDHGYKFERESGMQILERSSNTGDDDSKMVILFIDSVVRKSKFKDRYR